MSGISMDERDEVQERVRRYLLGRLTEDECQQIEERIFTDPAFFQQVRMTEEELLEDYVFKILPPEDTERVAQRLLLTPDQIQRWEIATALKSYSDTRRKPNKPKSVLRYVRSRWALPIAATVIAAVFAGVWMTRMKPLELTVTLLNGPGQNVGMQSDFQLELSALRLRSEPQANTPEQRVALPKQVDVVQIRLPIEVGSYTNYQTTLIREPDVTLFTLDNRQPIDSGKRKLLIVRVPADALVPGSYRLVIKGIRQDKQVDDLGIYLFTIV